MNVIGYVRVSTSGQAKDGYSLAYQQDEILSYCQEQGWNLQDTFIDEDTYEGDITNPLGLNLYSYVNNNPLKFIDPSGHCGVLPEGGHHACSDIDLQLLQYKSDYDKAATREERGNIAGNAKTLRDNNPGKWVVSSDKSLEYYKILDITDKLNTLMRENVQLFDEHEGDYIWFKNNIGYNRLFDLKTQEEWQRSWFIYDGNVVRNDAPGNIAYGYLGTESKFSALTLRVSAGAAQQISNAGQPIERSWIITNFGDAPGDWEFIQIGIDLWKSDNNYIWWQDFSWWW